MLFAEGSRLTQLLNSQYARTGHSSSIHNRSLYGLVCPLLGLGMYALCSIDWYALHA